MRILLVEDEPTLRAQLRSALQEAGYAVDEAADGQQAWVLAMWKILMPWCWTWVCRCSMA